MPTFHGSTPGQDLSEVTQRFSLDNLQALLGEDVVALVEAVTDPNNRISTLRRVAVQKLHDHPDELLRRQDLRAACLNATSAKKLHELAYRLGLPGIDEIHSLQLVGDATASKIFLGFYGIDARLASTATPQPEVEQIYPEFGLFPHQRNVADRAHTAIRDGHGRVVLHMPTGTGKTRTAIHIISRILTESEPCVIIWLAATAELLEQAADAFQNAWQQLGNREVQIMRFWGQHSPPLAHMSDGIIVAGLQKMRALNARDPIGVLRLGASTQLVVVDEAHQAIARTYSEVINALVDTGPNTALLGLTATPGRTWSDVDADKQLSRFFGERKLTIAFDDCKNPVSRLISQGYIARPTFSRLEYEAPLDLQSFLQQAGARENEYEDGILEALSMQVTRNVTIVHEIRRLIENGHTRVMFFGASVRHAKLIAVALSAVCIEASLVTAHTDATQRERIINAFRKSTTAPIVLCNFGVLTAGFDAPNTSACVIARPTKSLVLFSQMVGRATRGPKAGGNETCEVSTVVDVDLPGFRDLAEAFTNWEDVWHDAR